MNATLAARLQPLRQEVDELDERVEPHDSERVGDEVR